MGLFIPRKMTRAVDSSPIQKPGAGTRIDWSHPLAQGLIAYFPMNEGTGRIVGNMVKNDIVAIMSGFLTSDKTSNWNAGAFGSCLQFDGGDDYLTLGSPNTLMSLKYPYTISAWVQPRLVPSSGVVISITPSDPNSNIAMGTWSSSNQIFVGRISYQYGLSGISTYLEAGKWQHWCVVFTDPTNISFYLDGRIKTLSNVGNYFTAQGNMIGNRTSSTLFRGGIDLVAIHNRSLNSYEVETLVSDPFSFIGDSRRFTVSLPIIPVRPKRVYTGRFSGPRWLPPGQKPQVGQQVDWEAWNLPKPVGEWWFNEGTGNKVMDASGNGNNGTLTNMDPSTDWVAGKDGMGLDFDGSDDCVVLGSMPNSLTWTVFARVYIPTLASARYTLWGCENASSAQQIEIGTANIFGNYRVGVLRTGDASLKYISDANVLTAGSWHTISLVQTGINAGAVTCWINGIEVATYANAEWTLLTTAKVTRTIGRRITSQYLLAKVASLIYWPTNIPPSSIQNLQGPIPIRSPRTHFLPPTGGAQIYEDTNDPELTITDMYGVPFRGFR